MGDSFNKKEREKKKQKKKKEKEERRKERKENEEKSTSEFMYMDRDGNLSSTPPDPNQKKEEIKLEDIVISVPNSDDDDDKGSAKIGVVKFFDHEKGYGFIDEKNSKKSFFVHINDVIGDISDNNLVEFEVGDGPKGPVAKNVKISK